MELFVSGEAGYGAIWRGDTLLLTVPDNDPSEFEFPAKSFRYLFPNSAEVAVYNLSPRQDHYEIIRLEKNKNRSLILFLMLIDENEPEDIKESIPPVLESLVTDTKVRDYLQSVMISIPLPSGTSVQGALLISKQQQHLTRLLEIVEDAQQHLIRMLSCLQELPRELFSSPGDVEEIQTLLASSGAIANAAIGMSARADKFSLVRAKFDAFKSAETSDIVNVRRIISAWFDLIGAPRNQKFNVGVSKHQSDFDHKEEPHKKTDQKPTNRSSDYEAFVSATAQIDEIKAQLRQLNFPRARKFMEELKFAQVKANELEFASKSLCNIASYACDVYQYSFALEASREAVSVNSEDGRAWSQLADTLIHLGKFDEAEKSLANAKLWGESHFSASRLAGLLRLKGRTKEAEIAYRSVIREMSESEDLYNSYFGLGSLLCDEMDYEGSLEVFDEAIKKFPEDPLCRFGKARTLSTFGKLRESIEVHHRSLKDCGPTIRALTGLGRNYSDVGDLENAVKFYSRATKKFPLEPSGYGGLGQCHRMLGDHNQAHKIYDQMKREFPFDSSGFRGVAETFANEEKIRSSIEAFDLAIELFPKEPILRTRKAHLFKRRGRFEEALQQYGQILEIFPSSVYAQLGQADLLKELGNYEGALSFYNRVPVRNAYLDPNICMAAIHVSLGNYPKANSLLPNSNPRTRSEWVAYHIRGMSSLKSGEYAAARKIFSFGVRNVPFVSERSYFSSAMAIVALREKKFDEALELLDGRNDHVSNILQFHAYSELKMTNDAAATLRLLELNCPADVIPLRDKLARQAQTSDAVETDDSDWVLQQECNMLAMAATRLIAA